MTCGSGVGIIYYCLKYATRLLSEKLSLEGFKSGEYGSPPSIACWIRQLVVYVSCLSVMKLTVLGLFALWPGIFKIGEWLLSWLGYGDSAQVILWVVSTSVTPSAVLIVCVQRYGFIPNHHERASVLVNRLHRQSTGTTIRLNR